jgi:hypothetical protein
MKSIVADRLLKEAYDILVHLNNMCGHDEDICPCQYCAWIRCYELYEKDFVDG